MKLQVAIVWMHLVGGSVLCPVEGFGQTPLEPAEDAVRATFLPGEGLDVARLDGEFRLNIKGFGQMLYTAARAADEWRHGLALRRARLILSGNVWGKHNGYYVQLAFSPQDMRFENGAPTQSAVFDWYFKFDHFRDFTFQLGQYRVPFNKSRVIPYANLQFVDRTAANFEFNLDRDIGFDFRSDDFLDLDRFRYRAGIFVGEGRDGFGLEDFGMLYVARVGYFPLGLFDDSAEADLRRRSNPALAIGAAYAFIDNATRNATRNQGVLGSRPTDGGTADIHTVAADVNFKVKGFSVGAEFFLREARRDFGNEPSFDEDGDPTTEPVGVTPAVAMEGPRNGLGWFAQLGVMLPGMPAELTGRVGQIRPFGRDSSLARMDETGIGVNIYIFRTALAIKADYHHRFWNARFTNATNEIRLSLQAGF